jgi:hypothetical protein
LVVSLAGSSVANGIGPFLFGYLDLLLGDQRARNRSAEQILAFVDGVGAKYREDKPACELLPQIFDARLDRACLEGFFLNPVQFLILAQVGRESDDFAFICLDEPFQNDRRIKSAGICQNNLFDTNY